MMEDKVCKETATEDFERMVIAAEVDPEGMSDEELSDYDDTKRKFIRLIQRGKLTIDDNGLPTLHTNTDIVPELRFRSPYASVIIAQGRVTNNNKPAEGRAMIAEATGVAPKLIDKGVSGRDFIIAQKIMNFFLVD
jgi:hypothetical protein